MASCSRTNGSFCPTIGNPRRWRRKPEADARQSGQRRRGTDVWLGQVEGKDPENKIEREQLHAFDPVRFAVAADLEDDVNGGDDGENFRQRKFKVHRPSEE